MRIIAADDEPLALNRLKKSIMEAAPDADVHLFSEPEDIIVYASGNAMDVAFLDIEMGSMSGIEVAKRLKEMYPKINIIFVTGYDQYMAKAIELRMSGYVLKPVNKEKILVELGDLKHPVSNYEKKDVYIRCFGNFEVFVKGKPLEFEKGKTKEMLAYLVDRRGSMVTSGELRSILWDDAVTDDNTRSYLSKLKKDLVNSLKKAGIENIFIEMRGKYSIDTEKVSCDYFDYLDNNQDGVRVYNGEYMSQYSWGEINNIHFQK